MNETNEPIICAVCNRRFTSDGLNDVCDVLSYQEVVRINHYGGYLSKFGDLTLLKLDICDGCFKDMLIKALGSEEKLYTHVYNLGGV